jgi:acyl-homoserine lactone acylase PvdQ
MRRARVIGLACVTVLALAAPAAQAASGPAVQPYGTNDAGGFYNVLPPGEDGLDNAVQFGAFTALGTVPAHFRDQLPLYENLLYAAPTLTDAQIPQYFKDATFGVQPSDVASVESPRSDVTIERDKQYDVPHIYGSTRAGVEFGAGYAAAEDRLFLMDVLRHTAEASLSSFLGGSAADQAMDEAQWTVAPYLPADLQEQINEAPIEYGAKGTQIVSDLDNFVDGINAYIGKALVDPLLLPAEYVAIGKLPTMWTASDVIAESSLIGAIFGKGGGDELPSALLEKAFQQRFGATAGRAAWSDFREANDPEAATTVAKPFPYETGSAFAKRGLAMPDPGTIQYVSPGGTNPDTAQRVSAGFAALRAVTSNPRRYLGVTDTPTPVAIPAGSSLGSSLLESLYGGHPLASNWELVNAKHSDDGHSIAVMGPQVGYYMPQILMEEDLHGPGIDARGAAFPGVNLYVELGHGRDYAWSATTATSDNVDTFAEVLCDGSEHMYLYKGQCLPMQELQRTNSWKPNLDDSTPAGSATLTTWRTVHGLVFAYGTVNGHTKVAFVTARTTYFHEPDSAIGFSDLNNPEVVDSPQSFQHAAAEINFGFNWAYVDANNIAYFESGWYPDRAPGTSPDFPILGTGKYDWVDFNPTTHTEKDIPFSAHPQAINPPYLVSWNNKQAPEWGAADDNFSYGPIYRMQMIRDHITADIAAGHGRISAAQLVSAMDLAATEDIRIVKLWPIIHRVIGTPPASEPALRNAVEELQAWYEAGGHRWDLTHSGSDANEQAIQIMDAWWPLLLQAEFEPSLGSNLFNQLEAINSFGDETPGGLPAAPDEADGWYGYVDKDLRDLLATQHPGTLLDTAGNPVASAAKLAASSLAGRGPAAGDAEAATTTDATASAARAGRHHRRATPRRRRAGISVDAIPDHYSRIYCGGGSLAKCRAALLASLTQAIGESAAQIYGHGICAKDPTAECFDQNQSVEASGVPLPPFPFQNRPTFQQVVELTQTLPR